MDKSNKKSSEKWNTSALNALATKYSFSTRYIKQCITGDRTPIFADSIGKRTRYKPKIGWIGYHPSLLPRHRGRSSIEWAVRMRDAITGGTVFWLNSGIDRGDIANQDICFINPKLYGIEPKKAAKILWEHELQDMGLRLLKETLQDISNGIIKKVPQQKEYSTFEPNTDAKDVFKPDLLMIEQYGSPSH